MLFKAYFFHLTNFNILILNFKSCHLVINILIQNLNFFVILVIKPLKVFLFLFSIIIQVVSICFRILNASYFFLQLN